MSNFFNVIGKKCGGKTIARAFGACNGHYAPPTTLVSVQYEDGRYGVVIVDRVTENLTPLTAEGRLGMLLSEATQPPVFEVNTDCGFYEINIYTLSERGVIAREEYVDIKRSFETRWKVVGECSCGSVACRKFTEAGFVLEVN